MTEFRTIEIDMAVHKRIEMERRSFSESDNQVLHRLLGIASTGSNGAVGQRSWSGKGVTLPHGTQLRMEYNGTVHTGRIEDGDWSVEGQRFGSPSGAASVAKSKAGNSVSLDGWTYWHVKRPSDAQWILIAQLRDQHGLKDF